MLHNIKYSLLEAKTVLDNLINNDDALKNIEQAAFVIIECFQGNGRAFSCGNGGSMCDAMHFAEEFTGRFRKNRASMAATAISDPSHITCVANDYGYDHIFSRYIQAHGRKGDVLLAISTSGSSQTVLNAAKEAHNQNMKVIGLTSRPNSDLEKIVDVCVCTPGKDFADRVQELHIKVIHILIEAVERHFFPDNYR